jgi:hypothetical protein
MYMYTPLTPPDRRAQCAQQIHVSAQITTRFGLCCLSFFSGAANIIFSSIHACCQRNKIGAHILWGTSIPIMIIRLSAGILASSALGWYQDTWDAFIECGCDPWEDDTECQTTDGEGGYDCHAPCSEITNFDEYSCDCPYGECSAKNLPERMQAWIDSDEGAADMCSGSYSAYAVGKPELYWFMWIQSGVCCETGGNCRDEVAALVQSPDIHWSILEGLSWIACLIWIWFGFNVIQFFLGTRGAGLIPPDELEIKTQPAGIEMQAIVEPSTAVVQAQPAITVGTVVSAQPAAVASQASMQPTSQGVSEACMEKLRANGFDSVAALRESGFTKEDLMEMGIPLVDRRILLGDITSPSTSGDDVGPAKTFDV